MAEEVMRTKRVDGDRNLSRKNLRTIVADNLSYLPLPLGSVVHAVAPDCSGAGCGYDCPLLAVARVSPCEKARNSSIASLHTSQQPPLGVESARQGQVV